MLQPVRADSSSLWLIIIIFETYSPVQSILNLHYNVMYNIIIILHNHDKSSHLTLN